MHRFSVSTQLRGGYNEWGKAQENVGSLRNEKKLHKNFVVSFFFAYFAPRLVVNAFLAQLVEHVICNLKVVGSNPTEGSNFLPIEPGRYQSGQMGQTVNLLVFTFGGSNPSLPTK